jgi:hypothetical protein
MVQDDEQPENRRVGTVLESVVADLSESHDEATTQLHSAEAPPPIDTATFRLVVSELVGTPPDTVMTPRKSKLRRCRRRSMIRRELRYVTTVSHCLSTVTESVSASGSASNCGVRQLGDGSSLNGLPMAELPYTFFTTRARLTVTGIYAETADAFSIRLRSSFETLGSPRGTRGQHAGEP